MYSVSVIVQYALESLIFNFSEEMLDNALLIQFLNFPSACFELLLETLMGDGWNSSDGVSKTRDIRCFSRDADPFVYAQAPIKNSPSVLKMKTRRRMVVIKS